MSVAIQAVASDEVAILAPGEFHGSEVSLKSKRGWLALRQERGIWTLVPTRVSSQRVNDPVIDEEGQKTGVRISSDPSGVLLLRHASLRAGPLRGAIVNGNPAGEGVNSISPQEKIRFTFNGHEYALGVDGPERPSLIYPALLLTGPDGRISVQRPFTISESSSLVWAGDLDRDGMVDLVVDVSDHYNKMSYCLFLSGGQKLALKRMGCLTATGC